MYLSQLLFNPRNNQSRRDLADRFELHRTLLAAFPAELPNEERILFRVDDATEQSVPVLVQSQTSPMWEQAQRLQSSTYLLQPARVRQVEPLATQNWQSMFRLQANPTVKRDGKRHAIYREEDLHTWLVRKGNQHGFKVAPEQVQVRKLGNKYGRKQRQTWHAVQFDGLLQVVDAMEFSEALRRGIGSAKGFGFGLLSIPYPQHA